MSRAAVRVAMASQFRSALLSESVPVILGSSANDIPFEGVWLWDPETSNIDIPSFAGSATAIRDDVFRFQIRMVAGVPGMTAEEAEARVNHLEDIIETSIIENRWSEDTPTILSILPVLLQGPVTGPTTEGVISAMYLTVEVHERKGP